MSTTTRTMQSGEPRGLKGLRLTRRGKVVLALLCLALMGGILGVSSQAVAGVSPKGIEVETVTVRPGQSLWSFAAKVARPDEDIRNVVDEIQSLNGLSDASLIAGQRLFLPMRSHSDQSE